MAPMLNSTMGAGLAPSVASTMTMAPSPCVSPYVLRQHQGVSFPRPVLASSPVSAVIAPTQGQYVQNDVSAVGPSGNGNTNSFRLHQNNVTFKLPFFFFFNGVTTR